MARLLAFKLTYGVVWNVPSGPAGVGSGVEFGTGLPLTPFTASVEYANGSCAFAMRSPLTSSAWLELSYVSHARWKHGSNWSPAVPPQIACCAGVLLP